LVDLFFELDFFLALKKLKASSKEKALLSTLLSSFCDFPKIWETISFTLLIRLDAFFSEGAFVDGTFLALGFTEDDFTPFLACEDEVFWGLLDAAVTFFGAAFFATFALA
jgi:hypothetical protein